MVQGRYAELGGSRFGFTTAGLTDVMVVRFNPQRRKLIIVNDSTSTIYLVKGEGPAALNRGITLLPAGVWIIEPDSQGYLWKGEVHCICVAAGQNLTWTEDW